MREIEKKKTSQDAFKLAETFFFAFFFSGTQVFGHPSAMYKLLHLQLGGEMMGKTSFSTVGLNRLSIVDGNTPRIYSYSMCIFEFIKFLLFEYLLKISSLFVPPSPLAFPSLSRGSRAT